MPPLSPAATAPPKGEPSCASQGVSYRKPTPVSPGGAWASSVLPTPWSRLPARSVRGRAPLALAHPPPALTPWRYLLPRRRGRGTVLYSLIQKGETHVSPFENPLSCGSLPISQKASSSGGLSKGGGIASPLWNEIIDLYPPPMPVGYPPLLGKSMGGGERAPVALCREPTEPAGETRGHHIFPDGASTAPQCCEGGSSGTGTAGPGRRCC